MPFKYTNFVSADRVGRREKCAEDSTFREALPRDAVTDELWPMFVYYKFQSSYIKKREIWEKGWLVVIVLPARDERDETLSTARLGPSCHWLWVIVTYSHRTGWQQQKQERWGVRVTLSHMVFDFERYLNVIVPIVSLRMHWICILS